MSVLLPQWLGWLATGIFVSSYFLKKSGALRVMQMCGAALWILYGFLIRAPPVIVANALVFAAAAGTTLLAGRGLSSAKR
jgi:hypothetical protein